jgi:2-dehydro-3-deoxygalactonokinase
MVAPDWIAVDWGTTFVRAWAMAGNAEVLAEARSDRGMVVLDRSGFEPALRNLIGGWEPAPVFASGMVGSRQGWIEAPYTAVPCRLDALATVRAPVSDRELSVTVVGGVKQERPADVMRGEETQIAGYLAKRPDFDGVLCLPGTHSKWAQISAGEIVSFRSAMTGELFGLLSKASVLRHAMGDGWNGEAFADAASEAMSRPESLAARLFGIRAESLLHGLDGATARAQLSGLLVGAELAAMRPYWLGQEVVIIGEKTLNSVYSEALAAQGLAPESASADEMTRAGLARIRARPEAAA